MMDLVGMVGNLLTDLDTTLSRTEFTRSNPLWQQLYALRLVLDDQQRSLVKLPIDENDESYRSASAQITSANREIAGVISDPKRLADAIQGVAKATASMDMFLVGYKEPGPRRP